MSPICVATSESRGVVVKGVPNRFLKKIHSCGWDGTIICGRQMQAKLNNGARQPSR